LKYHSFPTLRAALKGYEKENGLATL